MLDGGSLGPGCAVGAAVVVASASSGTSTPRACSTPATPSATTATPTAVATRAASSRAGREVTTLERIRPNHPRQVPSAPSVSAMFVGVLGPTVVEDEGRAVGVPAAKHRALLAALALADGRPVPAEQLVAAIW